MKMFCDYGTKKMAILSSTKLWATPKVLYIDDANANRRNIRNNKLGGLEIHLKSGTSVYMIMFQAHDVWCMDIFSQSLLYTSGVFLFFFQVCYFEN